MDKKLELIIRRFENNFTWMKYRIHGEKENYTLIRFDDKLLGNYIAWLYVYDEHMDIEFRKSLTAEIDKEFRNIEIKRLPAFLKNIRHIY